ncbi:MAG: GAF domain-containing sensor histidine kinase [Candidatus Hodarchaeales archaeon]|jgi:signal transduction histidine kinase
MTNESDINSDNFHLETLVSITKAFMKYDFQTMLDYIIKIITERIDAKLGGIFLVKEDNAVLIAEVGGTPSLLRTVQQQALFPTRQSISGESNEESTKGLAAQTLLTEKTLVIDDISALHISQHAREVTQNLGITNILSSPIFYQGIPQGVLQVARTGSRPFTSQEISFIESIGAELGSVIIQKVSAEKDEETLDELEFMVDLLTHDVSSQAMIVWGCLEEILSKLDSNDDDSQFYVHTALQSLSRVQTIIDQVRILSSLKRLGKTDYTSIKLTSVFERSIKAINDMFPEMKIEITIKNEVENLTILGTTIIDNCFINLLQNAVLADNHPSKIINIKVYEASSNMVGIDIVDHGEGIPDKIKLKIFQRLFRARSTKRGSGLGLYITKTILEKFDGKIEVENRVKDDYTKGTRFKILLPKSENNS